MRAVESPLGDLREYFFNEILSKMSPRMGDYSPQGRTSHVWWWNPTERSESGKMWL